MDDRTRKLGITATCVALFAGFVALTKWTGDDPDSVEALGDQEQGELASFCTVFASGFVPYDLVLRAAAGQAVSQSESSELGILDSTAAQSLAQTQINLLADRVPDEYGADARQAAEGLERALDGDLDPEDVDEYVASFQRLEDRADEDCEGVEDTRFGPGFDDGGFGDDGNGSDLDGDGIDDEFDPDGGFGPGGPGGGGFDSDGDGIEDEFDTDGGPTFTIEPNGPPFDGSSPTSINPP